MLKQIFEIVLINLRSIPQRLGLSLVIVVGIAGVVGVFTALFAMSRGIEATFGASGDPRNVMVLRGGSQAELNSSLSLETLQIAERAPGVRRDDEDRPLAAGELIVIAELPKKGSTLGANVTLRGVTPAAFPLRPNLKFVEGRTFTPGLQELIVGQGAATQFEGLSVGATVRLRGADWNVVGIFRSGDSFDSEIWTDGATAQTAWGRNGFSSALVGLENPDDLATFEAALKADPRVNVEVKRQVDYFTEQTRQTTGGIRLLGLVVAVIMGLGAIFAALNTMYAAVSARTREIATLRAIGFRGLPVVASVMAEAMLLALVGGLLGALAAYVLFNGMTVSTLGGGFTQLVFQFRVSPPLVAQGALIALAIGFVGGLFPAVRSAYNWVDSVAICALGIGVAGAIALVIGGLLVGGVGSLGELSITAFVVLLTFAIPAWIFHVLASFFMRRRVAGLYQSTPAKATAITIAVLVGWLLLGWILAACLLRVLLTRDLGSLVRDPVLAGLRAG